MSKYNKSTIDKAYIKYIEELQKLKFFNGEPAQFWTEYINLLTSLSNAEEGIVAIIEEKAENGIRLIASSPTGFSIEKNKDKIIENNLIQKCFEEGFALTTNARHSTLALRLETGSTTEKCFAAFYYQNGNQLQDTEGIRLLKLFSDIPSSYQLTRSSFHKNVRIEHLANVLDLLVLINSEKKFLSATMTFCNELASRLRCERVSIGWFDKGYIKLKAISHVDRFEKKSESVKKLEETMEEALDQNTEVVYPIHNPEGTINNSHKSFAQSYDISYICSIPLRIDDDPFAVCTCERNDKPFSEIEIRLLRLFCDHVARRLSELKQIDRWFGARFAKWLRDKIGNIIGYKHTWIKVIVVIITIALGILIFGKFDYRISAPVIVRTENIIYLTAPFDGHIDQAFVRPGDKVKKDDNLLSLDKSDLYLQEASLVAEKNRYQREIEKHRASNALADMRISQALLDQSKARLDKLYFYLNKAIIKAPFDGIVVEGDQMERIGAPTKLGEVLFKIARIDSLYTELEVSESDIQDIKLNQQGEIAFSSMPKDIFKINVFRIEPVAVPKEKGNIFIVNCNFIDNIQNWWRPGMTGIAKLDAGKRNILWIISHKTIDFLRLRLWL